MLDRIYKGCKTGLCEGCESNHYNQQNDYREHVEFSVAHKECKDLPDCAKSVHEPYSNTLFINRGSISKRQVVIHVSYECVCSDCNAVTVHISLSATGHYFRTVFRLHDTGSARFTVELKPQSDFK